MTGHTCPTCCQALSYLDAVLRVDADATAPRWWRILHPLRSRDVRVRRGYALDLLDESGK